MKFFEAKNRFTKVDFQRDEEWDIYPKSEYTCSECGEVILFTFKDFAKHSNSDFSNLDQGAEEEISKKFSNPKEDYNSFLDFYCPNCKIPTRVYYLFWAGGRFTHGYRIKYVALLNKI